jgi:dTDP-glucose 4,6-dehydratase
MRDEGEILSHPKSLLLTGAGGFAGSHMLQEILESTNWNVVCVASFRHKGLQDRIKHILNNKPHWNQRVKIVIHDLQSPISKLTSQQIGKIDFVVNFASESHFDRSIKFPYKFISNNVTIILNLLEWAREKELEQFIQISTDEVYGDHSSSDPSREWVSIIRPSNPYAASKAAQENICVAYARTYGVPIKITNTVNMFGEMQDPEKFLPTVINSILKKSLVKIHAISQTEIGSRVYLHAQQNASAILFILMNNLTSNNEGGIPKFHISSMDVFNNLEMAQLVAGKMRSELMYEIDYHVLNRPGHDFHYSLDGSSISQLGWKPHISFLTSLERTIDFYLDEPMWLDSNNFMNSEI